MYTNLARDCVIAGFRRDVDENCALFWVITQKAQESLTLEDGTDKLSRNVGKKIPLIPA